MLTRTRLVSIAFAALTIAATVLPAGLAHADVGGGSCPVDPATGQRVCSVAAGGGGSPGSGSSPSSGDPTSPAGFTPGPTTCSYQGQTIPCQGAAGWWDASQPCYMQLMGDQGSAPSGQSANAGAWYMCTEYCPPAASKMPGACLSASVWLTSPPPGIDQYTPAEAAGLVVKLLRLSPVGIGMAPAGKVHADDPPGTAAYRRTWVGIPVWLWVANPDASTWGPQSVTATYGGVTVTATATAGAVTWSSGDGQSVTCGTGTVFDEAYWADKPATDSPSCGWRYQHIGQFTVTASTVWTVHWVGGGQNGQIAMPTTQSTTQVQVGQLESVNTPVTPSMLAGK